MAASLAARYELAGVLLPPRRCVQFVRVYDYSGAGWVLVGSTIVGRPAHQFGRGLSLSGDGTRVAVGSPTFKCVDVYGYVEADGAWAQVGQTIEGGVGDLTGIGVSLSQSGSRLAVGSGFGRCPAPGTSGSTHGYVTVYDYNSVQQLWEPLGNTLCGDSAGE